jgi:hypothetical protein
VDLHASDLPPPRQRRFAVHRHVQCGSGNARSGWLLGLAKFQVPEYGTHVEYPARLFAPVGEPEKGIGQRFEKEDGRAVLSRIRRTTHLLVISERTYGNPRSIANGSPALSLPFQWNEMGQSFIADATSLLAVPPYIVSTWCIHRAKKGLGPCGNTHQSLVAAA